MKKLLAIIVLFFIVGCQTGHSVNYVEREDLMNKRFTFGSFYTTSWSNFKVFEGAAMGKDQVALLQMVQDETIYMAKDGSPIIVDDVLLRERGPSVVRFRFEGTTVPCYTFHVLIDQFKRGVRLSRIALRMMVTVGRVLFLHMGRIAGTILIFTSYQNTKD